MDRIAVFQFNACGLLVLCLGILVTRSQLDQAATLCLAGGLFAFNFVGGMVAAHRERKYVDESSVDMATRREWRERGAHSERERLRMGRGETA